MNQLNNPISGLPRTAPATIKKMQSIGIQSFRDLLYYIPTRYKDYSTIVTKQLLMSQLPIVTEDDDEVFETPRVTVQGIIRSFDQIRTRTGLTIQKAIIDTSDSTIEAVWFNQRFLFQLLKKGAAISAAGILEKGYGKASLKVEEFELCDDWTKTIHTGRLVPVYSEIKGLSSKTIREKIAYALGVCAQDLYEELPEEFVQENHFLSLDESWRTIHFPHKGEDIAQARARLAFDEVFSKMLSSAQIKKSWQTEHIDNAITISKHADELGKVITALPYTLTGDQNKALDEIFTDLEKNTPMNRMLQGDVGSGKTVVAALAAYEVFLNHKKTLIMAPTDILARQHFATFETLFISKSISRKPVIVLHTGSNKQTKHDLDAADIIIGTHALISDTINLTDVGLVVVDEQHKFGVSQRARLKEKGMNSHMVSMTATPIPRTVCLALYGELDISSIKELPKGRIHIKTYLVPSTKRGDSYEWMKTMTHTEKLQIYIICPFIEQSESETLTSVKAAQKEYEYLKNEIFTDFTVGLLHGRMKSEEKDAAMKDFSQGKLDVLVATSLVEVGVDVPNANIIVIEGAERFGLAQLHQLRGRVGRSQAQAYCLLFPTEESPTVHKRLELFTKTTDGFKLAEYDLAYRGSGDLYGLRQHGEADLKIASYADSTLITKVHDSVEVFMKKYDLSQYPQLEEQVKKYMDLKIAKN